VVVEDVRFDAADEALVVSVRPRKGAAKARCGVCGRRCPGYDQGSGRRRWRALDLGTVQAFVEAEAPRVRCPEHGVVVLQVPWARHAAGHTYAFDHTVAWLAVQASRSAVQELMRVAWRTVAVIVARVSADAAAKYWVSCTTKPSPNSMMLTGFVGAPSYVITHSLTHTEPLPSILRNLKRRCAGLPPRCSAMVERPTNRSPDWG
jgi:hypothetical protein